MELQTQLHDTHPPPSTSHVYKVCALEGVVAEHDTIKCETGVLKELVEKLTAEERSGDNDGRRNCEEEGEEFGSAFAEADDNDSRSIQTIIPHELERVNEENGQQLAKEEEDK